jgi:hypothetical protein
MDKFKLTSSEYAKMLGITTSAVRKKRLAGKIEGEYIKKDSKYFYASPSASRPNKDEFTPYKNPKFTLGDRVSVFRPKKHPCYYYRKKNRDVPYDETRYENAPNGHQLQLTNDLRQKARIDSKLKASELEYITDDLVLEVKRKIAKEKADKVKRLQEGQRRSLLPDYTRTYREPSAGYNLPMTGRWYNHATQKMEDYSPKKKKYKYYDI